jgi:hypothetical protein
MLFSTTIYLRPKTMVLAKSLKQLLFKKRREYQRSVDLETKAVTSPKNGTKHTQELQLDNFVTRLTDL